MPLGQATYYSYISPELAVGLSKFERIHPFGSPGHKDLLGFVLNPPLFWKLLMYSFPVFISSSQPSRPGHGAVGSPESQGSGARGQWCDKPP